MRARVIGLGQAAGGDDGVGLAVVEWLRQRGVPDGVELRIAAEASALMSLLEVAAPVVVVDAALGAPAGRVLELNPEALDPEGATTVSSHGLGVFQAIELARLLSPGAVSPSIRVIAVTIARPERYGHGLSPQVAEAVPRAAARILALTGASPSLTGGSTMHETSLAREVLKVALDRAAQCRASRIRVVRGWIAETESLSPDGLRFHFTAHARGTPAEGADLEFRLIRVEARCDACRHVYAPEHHLLLCPECGATGGELLGRTGLGIDTLEVE